MDETGDLDRRVGNLLRIGTVAELDEAAARVRVASGGLLTDWLPWLTHRAGEDRTWHAPEVGEQVLILAPGGELDRGVVLPAIYQDAYPPPAAVKTRHRTEYKDGGFIEYDRGAHHYRLDVPAGGNIVLHIGASTLTLTDSGATLETPALLVDSPQSTFTGQVLVKGKLTYQGGMAGSGGSGAAAQIAGSVAVTGGDFAADGYTLKGHKHTGVDAGNSTSGPATP